MAKANAKTKSKTKSDPKEEFRKEFKINGEKLVAKIKNLVKEGNATRIIIKNEKGKEIMEIPLTVGAVGVLLAPILAAVGALAVFLTECTVVVVKDKH